MTEINFSELIQNSDTDPNIGHRIRVTDRDNQIYIYAEKGYVPEITWTNCAEQMPPDDETMIICTYGEGMIDKMQAMIFHAAVKLSRKANGETYIGWTEFTKEKWEALTK